MTSTVSSASGPNTSPEDVAKEKLLNELLEVRGENVDEMDISALLLTYFEEHKNYKRAHSFVGEAWTCTDQAARRLHLASLKGGPRCRLYPGSKMDSARGEDMAEAKAKEHIAGHMQKREKTRGKLKELKKKDRLKDDSLRSSSRLSDAAVEKVSEVLVANGVTADEVEEEVQGHLHDAVRQNRPLDAQFQAELERMVSVLIRDVIQVAEEHVHELQKDVEWSEIQEGIAQPSSGESVANFQRIESYAAHVVADLTEAVSRKVEESQREKSHNSAH